MVSQTLEIWGFKIALRPLCWENNIFTLKKRFIFFFSCKEVTHVFGENYQLLENVEKLGSIPLEVEIMRHADNGTPFVVTHPESKATEVYLNIGRKLMSKFSPIAATL